MFDFFSFFNRIFGGQREDTRSAARDRLRLVLVSDRATVAPHLMESLRNELIEVISRYMEIDTSTMQMGLERHQGAMALAANIPVRSVHRSSAEMAAVSLAPPPGQSPRTARRPAAVQAPAVLENPQAEKCALATESVTGVAARIGVSRTEAPLQDQGPGTEAASRTEGSRLAVKRRARRHKRKA